MIRLATFIAEMYVVDAAYHDEPDFLDFWAFWANIFLDGLHGIGCQFFPGSPGQ